MLRTMGNLEVQDNKLLEIDLLFTLVSNPHGIHFGASRQHHEIAGNICN